MQITVDPRSSFQTACEDLLNSQCAGVDAKALCAAGNPYTVADNDIYSMVLDEGEFGMSRDEQAANEGRKFAQTLAGPTNLNCNGGNADKTKIENSLNIAQNLTSRPTGTSSFFRDAMNMATEKFNSLSTPEKIMAGTALVLAVGVTCYFGMGLIGSMSASRAGLAVLTAEETAAAGTVLQTAARTALKMAA